jgi:predicted transcriptional regulator
MARRAQAGRRRVADYHQLTIRVPPETERLLDAAAFALNRARYRLVVDALNHYLIDGQGLQAEDRRKVHSVYRA